MNPLPVGDKRLANGTVRLRDATLANCALLPLFNGSGVTAKVVLLSARTRECWVLDWRPGLVYVPLWGAARMDVARAATQQAASAGPLWFYDPPGLIELGMASLCGGIAGRNVAAVLPKTVSSLNWRRDLSRILGVSTKKGGGEQWGRWKREWLPDSPSQPTEATPPPAMAAAPAQSAAQQPARPVRRWVLDPIWMR